MTWKNCLIPSKVRISSNIIFFAFSAICNTFKTFCNVKFLLGHFLWTIIISSRSLSSFLLTISPSLQSSGCISSFSSSVSVNIAIVNYFFCNSIYKFHLNYYFVSLLHFILIDQFPLLITNFCKMSSGFITGRKGGNTTICFALHVH